MLCTKIERHRKRALDDLEPLGDVVCDAAQQKIGQAAAARRAVAPSDEKLAIEYLRRGH